MYVFGNLCAKMKRYVKDLTMCKYMKRVRTYTSKLAQRILESKEVRILVITINW